MYLIRKIWICLAALLLIQCTDKPAPSAAPDRPAPLPPPPADIIAADAAWETLAGGYVYSDSPAADAAGNVYYAAITQNRIYRITPGGEISLFADDTAMTMGLNFGADGRLYACRNRDAQIVVYAMDGTHEVLVQGELTPLPGRPAAPGEFCNDLAVSSEGAIWYTDRVNRQVRYLHKDGSVSTVASGFRPNGISLSADESMLVVTDSNEPRLWAFKRTGDGLLEAAAEQFEPIVTVDKLGQEAIAQGRPGTNGMTVDREGRFYVTSFYGIQIYSPDGRNIGVISKPVGFVSNLTFGGPEFNYLYATGLNGIYRLPTLTHGARYLKPAN